MQQSGDVNIHTDGAVALQTTLQYSSCRLFAAAQMPAIVFKGLGCASGVHHRGAACGFDVAVVARVDWERADALLVSLDTQSPLMNTTGPPILPASSWAKRPIAKARWSLTYTGN